MAQEIKGNTKGLAPAEIKALNRLYSRKLSKAELISLDFGRELYEVATKLRRMLGILVDREGHVLEVFLGTREIIYIPDLGRYRLGEERLRRIRLIYTDLTSDKTQVLIPNDILVDLEKLRFDAVVGLKFVENRHLAAWAYNLPFSESASSNIFQEQIANLSIFELDFAAFIENLEAEHSSASKRILPRKANSAVLVGVYDVAREHAQASMDELQELARTAGVNIAHVMIQRRKPDPKTLLGKGKLEEVILTCLRFGAEILIFDTESSPSQWRIITRATDLKVLDRSMLILDIFAQRAQSSDGRLQVELAQLKYNLPRLVEKDAGLSRLSGGIGGRGPGETKLEIGRRRFRERITRLEEQLKNRAHQRELSRSSRKSQGKKLVSLLGYTNVGKSTLFNALTQSNVLVENKLFATLDSSNRKLHLATSVNEETGAVAIQEIVIADTVGFIRDLPKELKAAFKATLEELYDAVILLQVVDLSDPNFELKIKAVNGILEEMGLLDRPMLYVFNKVDLVANLDLVIASKLSENKQDQSVYLSAAKKTGLLELKNKLLEMLRFAELQTNCIPREGLTDC